MDGLERTALLAGQRRAVRGGHRGEDAVGELGDDVGKRLLGQRTLGPRHHVVDPEAGLDVDDRGEVGRPARVNTSQVAPARASAEASSRT